MDENEKVNVPEDTQEEAAPAASTTSDNNGEAKARTSKEQFLSDITEILESALITIFVIIMVFCYILHPVNIVGHSMVPTLNTNYDQDQNNCDRIFMTTIYGSLKYGDIVIVNNNKNYLLDDSGIPYVPTSISPLNECIIKRVIAVGGQTIDIKDGQVIVDGNVLDEPYINEGSSNNDLGAFSDQYPITIPEGYYFVMGDNRNHSTDSRDSKVGLVKEDQVYGKAVVRYSPIQDFKILLDSYKG